MSQKEMTLQIVKEENTYQAAFEALPLADSPSVSWLSRLRQSAIDRFAQVGFPSVKEEEWKYTNVAPITRIDFAPATTSSSQVDKCKRFTYPEAAGGQLVF